MSPFDQYSELWLVDFEFRAPSGCRQTVICMVAVELRSGRRVVLWQDELYSMDRAPFDTGPGALFVSYYASAEMNCFLSLGWTMPQNVLDLYVEFRCHTNGTAVPHGVGLLGALLYFGLPSMGAVVKSDMRDLIMTGGPFTAEDRRAILDYCGSDVDALARLLPAMEKLLTPHALLRGSYMKAVGCMEYLGVPLDVPMLARLKEHREELVNCLIDRIAGTTGIYEDRTFKQANFGRWLKDNNIQWPRLPSGQLALDDDTFKSVSLVHPVVRPLWELRRTLSLLREVKLSVGPDGRCHQMLSAFRSKTGRNQPSSTRFIFGLPAWLRFLIKPAPGNAVAYIDWAQQEFGIGAALSGDTAMQDAYLSGDPYLGFAALAGAVPEDATKKSHPRERELFKVIALAVQYCMGPQSVAIRLGMPEVEARHLLELHHKAFPVFWQWSDAAIDYAQLNGRIRSVFGWYLHITDKTNLRSIRNFPMQANGAEMMRLAACYATGQDIRVCCPVHDAFLIEAPVDLIDCEVTRMQKVMAQASSEVLGGFELTTDAAVYRSPERYSDKRGETMWRMANEILEEIDPGQG